MFIVRHVRTAAVALAAALAFSLAVAVPAHASSNTTKDKVDDVDYAGADITSVKVRYVKDRVTVAIRIKDLPKDDRGTSYRVWFDTSNKKGKPNYMLAIEGYHLLFGTTKGWNLRTNKDPFGDVMCNPGDKYDRKNDRIIFRFKPKCIGNPGKIRVAVTAERYEFADDGEYYSERDHHLRWRKFTPWVRR